ncbi:universal stress protein [Halorussus gelatinilyticus]|uniref:Universal stress protein n=1 Tax=Halorussus gelatinilyticus TaxID=2937524 RepID=A0A8U0IL84_9EURY|nr:universal stress protein [Halorussus gelatinilyticus]UPW01415.1 universal stress protein [Halorussus gelatinilyticus]
MYDTVLLPTDGSEAMETVVEHARDIAERRGADVHVLYVVDDRAFLTLDDDRIPEVTDGLQAEGERATDAVASDFDAAAVSVSTEIREGNPADEILAVADERDADLVVMGSHGSDPTRNMLGSVSQKVVTLSSVPVLTVDIADADSSAGDN